MSPLIRSRGYLPHWEDDYPVYFVTFRLADSLPRELLARLGKERESLVRGARAGTDLTADSARLRKSRAILRKSETRLDDGLGACYMRDRRIAKIVADVIRHFDGERYRLLAWCVMPNHAHAVFSPLGEWKLEGIVHSWKSFSASAANRVLGRSGAFWQREYFDRWIRNEKELCSVIRYVELNPVKAGLALRIEDWPWSSAAKRTGDKIAGAPTG